MFKSKDYDSKPKYLGLVVKLDDQDPERTLKISKGGIH